MANHTPGRWQWIKHDGWSELVHYLEGETFPNGEPAYARVHTDGSAGGEYGADIDVDGPDARLIASSPDLLAACVEALFDLRLWQASQCRGCGRCATCTITVPKLVAAIALATGE